MVETLLELDLDVNSTDKSGYNTPLRYAARNGNLEILNSLLGDSRVDVNLKEPLALACDAGQLEVVKRLLLRKDVVVNQINRFGNTPLRYAAKLGRVDIAEELLKHDGIDVNLGAPLALAARHGRLNTVQVLLKRTDIDVNAEDGKGETALRIAAEAGHLEIVEELLKRDEVEIDERNADEETALDLALRRGHSSVVQLLSDHRKEVSASKRALVGGL